jgi:hypothetical protein
MRKVDSPEWGITAVLSVTFSDAQGIPIFLHLHLLGLAPAGYLAASDNGA